MASALLLLPLPSLFRSSTPNDCSHAKMSLEAPVALVEARPPVQSGEGAEQVLVSFLTTKHEFSWFRGAA